MDERVGSERVERKRREAKPRDAGSGEGAASALVNLRAMERNRDACTPSEQVQPASSEPVRSAPSGQVQSTGRRGTPRPGTT